MRRSTLRELAAAAGLAAPLPTSYGSFADFTDTITAAAGSLRTAEDARRLTTEIVEDAAADGAVWVEPSMWPGLFGGRLGSDADAIEIVLTAGREAADRAGIGFGLVVAANRDKGPEAALALARIAVTYAGAGVVGFGLDGDETAAGATLFVEAFNVARDRGLRSVPHAGELLGPPSVVEALNVLGADRIMHGVRAAEDPALVDRLAAVGTVLDVCPTSNLRLSVYRSWSEHPLPTLLRAGVRCSLNADDPLLFETDLLGEYRHAAGDLGLRDAELAGVARASLAASAAPGELIRQAYADIDRWLGDGT